MFKNVHYDKRNGMIHLWEEDQGHHSYQKIPWVPHVHVPVHEETEVKSLYGENVVKKKFKNFREYNEFCERNEERAVYENNVKPEIQFLCDRYYKIEDEKIKLPKLKKYILDIETAWEKGTGWSKPVDALNKILLISLIDTTTKRVHTWGLKPYKGEYLKSVDLVYRNFNGDEASMLLDFLNWVHENAPDVWTGWNVYKYDFLYLFRRVMNVLGDSYINKFSPIKDARIWPAADSYNLDIAGSAILDYLDLYKQYKRKMQENYKLKHILKVENIELQKLDFESKGYNNLKELQELNWDLFVEYNIDDVRSLDMLDMKLDYISTAQFLSLYSRSPIKLYNSMTQINEGVLLTYCRRNKLCAPQLKGGKQLEYEAGYVKDPYIGRYEYIIDLDIASSYPTHIILCNMSVETFIGKISSLTEDEVIRYTTEREFPEFFMISNNTNKKISGAALEKFNKAVKSGTFAIAPNGAVFNTKVRGIMSSVEKLGFMKRKEVKSLMIELKEKLNTVKDEAEKAEMNDEVKKLFALQYAIKVVLNSLYGASAVKYSRYFNPYIAEAICACGRHTVRQGQVYVNQLLNNPSDDILSIIKNIGTYKAYTGDSKDYILYIDTDSLFINLQEFILTVLEDGQDWLKLDDDEKTAYILKLSKIIEAYVNDKSYEITQLQHYNSQVTREDFAIVFKQEVVAKAALFAKKKKYTIWSVNEEGAKVDNITIKGLEIIRSDSPRIFKEAMKKVNEYILKAKSDEFIINFLEESKKSFMTAGPIEIAENKSINNIAKYIVNDAPIKGAPYHLKAYHGWKVLAKELNIADKYDEIEEGQKVKLIYVKKNQYNIECIAFNQWPEEFEGVIEIDFDKMIENHFNKKLELLFAPINKTEFLNPSAAVLNYFF